MTIELPLGGDHSAVVPSIAAQPEGTPAELWGALRLGLGDYVRKNGFDRVLLGLSGGIDSALVAALAADALGADRVETVSMPTRYNSSDTRSDARLVAERLGVAFRELAIEDLRLAFEDALPGTSGLAAENLQARIRGVLLMTLSNQHGLLVLTTGNKSETAVGYSTLYGDMAGGFAPIKDVPKTLVFALARYVNEQAGSELIPASIIDRPPSAELRDEQRDDQSLPPYEQLDPLLEAYVEDDLSPEEIARRGLATLEVAQRIARLVDLAEYKRRQAPPASACTTRPSAATGACRSRTASAADAPTPPAQVWAPPTRARPRVRSNSIEEALVPTWLWIVIVIGALVLVALVATASLRGRRTEQLRQGFGPEYDRAVERAGDQSAAEADLRDRQRRHEELELRPLEPFARQGFLDAWQNTQAEFVDNPAIAINDADRLIQSVMRDRGYPVEDFEDRASIVSVDHPVVVERYRRAHAVAMENTDGATDTEHLRRAMHDFRALFVELVEDNVEV